MTIASGAARQFVYSFLLDMSAWAAQIDSVFYCLTGSMQIVYAKSAWV